MIEAMEDVSFERSSFIDILTSSASNHKQARYVYQHCQRALTIWSCVEIVGGTGQNARLPLTEEVEACSCFYAIDNFSLTQHESEVGGVYCD